MKDNIFDNPRTYTLSSLILGYLLIGDLSAYEQNALGNWLMTIAQILESNSAIQQLFEANIQAGNININSKEAKNNKEAYIKKILNNQNIDQNELNNLKKTIEYLEHKLNELKKNIN